MEEIIMAMSIEERMQRIRDLAYQIQLELGEGVGGTVLLLDESLIDELRERANNVRRLVRDLISFLNGDEPFKQSEMKYPKIVGRQVAHEVRAAIIEEAERAANRAACRPSSALG